MLKRVSTSVSQAAVLIEDLTEDVAAAATEGASMVSRGRQGGDVQPQVAIELLWRLHHMGLSDKAEGAQVSLIRESHDKEVSVDCLKVHCSI